MKKYGFIVVLLAAALIAAHLPAQAGITDGLVGYWKFDEGVGITAADASIEVYPAQTPKTATLYNGLTWTDGFIGKALSFDGTDDYAEVNAATEINNLGPLTYSAWVNTRAASGYIFHSPRRFVFYNTQLRFDDYTTNLAKSSANNALPLNQWVHVAVTWDGGPLASGVHMFVNGIETSYSYSVNGAGTPQTSSTFLIGKYPYPTQPYHYLNGSLDEAAIYSRALSASEIQELYALTAGGSSIPLTPINTAPVISSLPATAAAVWPNPAALAAFVSDDGLPTGASVTTQWSVISGAGAVSFTRQTYSVTDAAFSVPGSYAIRLSATDGVLSSYRDVQVTVMPEPLKLQIQKSGTGSGSVSGSGINCLPAGQAGGSDCAETFSTTTPVTLSATPAEDSVFLGWAGGGCTGTGACTVTVDSAKTVTAFFDTLTTGSREFYVDNQNSSASDTNPGTQALPWKTIQKAASTAQAGDKVIVKRGEYKEFVSIANSGMADKPIVFEGERDSNGHWLTIIDPSTPASTGWVPAPEIGAGVYKKTNVPFETHELTIDHKRVGFVYTMDALPEINDAYDNSGLTTGAQILAMPADAQLMSKFSWKKIRFWDGVEALYGAVGNTTYLRLRNGEDPNGMNIRAAPNKDGSDMPDMHKPVFKIQDKSYITLRNFMMRGAIGCVLVSGANTHHNIIESNHLSNGYTRVPISGRAYENVVRNNEITANYYGYNDPGAWGGGSEYRYLIRGHHYMLSKFLMGASSTLDSGIYLSGAGNSNVISGNHIFKGLGTGIGVYSWTGYSPTQDTDIFDNTIENEPSIGILLSEGHTGTKVHDNLVSDCNINMRFHHMNTAGETDRIVYIYRNKLWLPQNAGEHIYAHFYDDPAAYNPEFWVYHNSFSGGKAGLIVSSFATQFASGVPNFRFLNNIFSGAVYIDQATLTLMTNKAMLGIFDYNLITAPFPTYPITYDPAWFGAQNIKVQSPIWSTASMPDFVLPSSSPAIDAGVDLSRQFVIDGVSYNPLPGMNSQYFEGIAPDIGAYEYISNEVYGDLSGNGAITAYDAGLALEQGKTTLEAAEIGQKAAGLS